MIDHPFRSWLANKSDLIIATYKFFRLTPNGVTMLGCILGLGAAALAAHSQFIPALTVWWLGRLLDGTDGIYARHLGKSSNFGGYLDIVCDMTAYSAMIWGFSISLPEQMNWWFAILILYVLCITSALSFGSMQKPEEMDSRDNRSLKLAAGLAEGGETGIFYTLVLLWPTNAEILCAIWSAILVSTVISRSLIAHREVKG
jgi:phosphatidylglycerophosphate synthase